MSEILPGLRTPQPLQEGAIMGTNSSLRQRLILALTTDAVELDSASAEWACRARGPKPNPRLSFQTSFLTFLAKQPSRLRIPEPQRCPLPAHQKKNVALWVCPETPSEDQPARPSTAPQLDRLTRAIMLCLTRPEARRPDSQADGKPQTQPSGHAMALGRHLYPTWVFRHRNLDIICNPCTAG